MIIITNKKQKIIYVKLFFLNYKKIFFHFNNLQKNT